MAYLNKEGVFQRWNVPFVRYDLQSNVTVFFDFVCTENTRKRLKASKTIEYELACRFELFQFPPVASWNLSFTDTHMELRHTVATHQWTRKPVYYNYNTFFLQLIYSFNNCQWKIMKLKQCNIKVFFYVWLFILVYFSFAPKRRQCWQFVLGIFQVNVFSPMGRKFFGHQKICAGDQI